jgi:hypothetical protein
VAHFVIFKETLPTILNGMTSSENRDLMKKDVTTNTQAIVAFEEGMKEDEESDKLNEQNIGPVDQFVIMFYIIILMALE